MADRVVKVFTPGRKLREAITPNSQPCWHRGNNETVKPRQAMVFDAAFVQPKGKLINVVRDGVTTNGIESVFAVLKRGIYGVYHHTSQKHLGRLGAY
jgi:hypothetical protein